MSTSHPTPHAARSPIVTHEPPPPARAFWFGPPERLAFGSFHAPRGVARGVGVALCPSLGHELLSARGAYRQLAARLAAQGFAVLRFDYHGTGDSAGSDDDPDRVAAWLATIDDAVGVLRDAGCGRVALFGARAGAAFAATAAARRRDVDAVLLVAPLIAGRAFLPELRAMHDAHDRGRHRRRLQPLRDGDEEALGFVYRRQTLETLGALDLRALASRPAPRALVIPRDDVAGGEARLAQRFRALGAQVDVVLAPGCDIFAADEVAGVPTEMGDAIVGWLGNLDGCPRRRTANVPRKSAAELADEGVVETVTSCGADARISAILTEPRGVGDDVGVVIAQTGTQSRVGPGRLGVALARRLAARGHGVLRVDGLGDVAPHDGAAGNELDGARAVAAVSAAVDTLAARGYRRFVAVGLCSAAHLSVQAALADPRIGAVALMSPLAVEWGHDATSAQTRRRRVPERRSLAARMRLEARGLAQSAALRLGRDDRLTSGFTRSFVALARRDARVLLVFENEESMLDAVETRLRGARRWLERRGLEIALLEEGDDRVAARASRERAIARVEAFVQRVASLAVDARHLEGVRVARAFRV